MKYGRKRFEKWMSETYRFSILDRDINSSRYIMVETNIAWNAWKAAKKDIPPNFLKVTD